ncbi:beta-galactosidase, partial [bacterium]|nr:beta-galactosidase [bacterium]
MRALVFLGTALLCLEGFAVNRIQWGPSGPVIDGQSAEFLYGAELQYFRARAGATRNIPAAAVQAAWEKLLDRFSEAKMNTAIFYIPWDFHEPIEGKFDFDGTLDQDGDGKPDYPSRNLKLFFQLLQKRGIRHLMVRPGPYINAEWGPEGFGAVPKWFLDGYPQALAGTQTPNKPRVVTFAHPDFQLRVQRWFRALHQQVLKDWIGPGKPIEFLQLDNETNYFWDSVYERDWSALSLDRYRSFVRKMYQGSEPLLRQAYGASAAFARLMPPKNLGEKTFFPQWHYDWASFHDDEIREHHRFLKDEWIKLGVTDQVVQFTTCESFNALNGGMLPRLDHRQQGGLALATLNIYPKTAPSPATLNNPMKAAHDAHLMASSQLQYLQNPFPWVMASETMGGWFPPTQVTLGARNHTYGSLLGAGVKSIIIYYFHEGWNWTGTEGTDSELQFDAPLDKDLQPRASFALVKSLGEALQQGLGAAALQSQAISVPVLIAHDSLAQYSVVEGKDAQTQASTQSAALFGLLREAGYLPDLRFTDYLSLPALQTYRAVWVLSPGYLSQNSRQILSAYARAGGVVFSVGDSEFKGPNVIPVPADFAKGWNDDTYATNQGATQIQQVRNWMDQIGIARPVTATAADGEGKLHVWLRQMAGDQRLVFIEN